MNQLLLFIAFVVIAVLFLLGLSNGAAYATNASSDAAVTAANPYVSDVGAPENVEDFLPAPTLTVRDNLLAYWNMRIYDTMPFPRRAYLRAARWLEARYWLWNNGQHGIQARRYFRQRIERRGRRIVIRPPVKGTIGPVRYVHPYGWSPGYGQSTPTWWDDNLGDNT